MATAHSHCNVHAGQMELDCLCVKFLSFVMRTGILSSFWGCCTNRYDVIIIALILTFRKFRKYSLVKYCSKESMVPLSIFTVYSVPIPIGCLVTSV